MGKKRLQQKHQTESFGSMVSKAALTQLFPHIQAMVQQLGQRLAIGQATSTEKVFTRIIAIEKLMIDKGLATKEELVSKIADVEDERDGVVNVQELALGDTARISATTKKQDETEYKNDTTTLKVENIGTGNTLGLDVEPLLLGMKVGEVREVRSSKDENALDVKITLNRAGRPIKEEALKQEEPKNENPVQE